MKSEEEVLKVFKAWGITNRRTQRALLALVEPDRADDWIIERWQKLKVLDEDRRIVLGKGEDIRDKVTWIIFAEIWNGNIERVSP